MGCNCSNCAVNITFTLDCYTGNAECEFDVVPPAGDSVVEVIDVTDGVTAGSMGLDSSNGNHRVYKETIGVTSGHQYKARITCICPCVDDSSTAQC